MEDFNYVFSSCFEITVELSCCKYPKAELLQSEWLNNQQSLLSYLETVHIGIKGLVTDQVSGQGIPKASISVQGILQINQLFCSKDYKSGEKQAFIEECLGFLNL